MRKSIPISVRLSSETFQQAQDIARRTSRPLGAIVSELAEEALETRRHPGIAFGGPPGDRRARVEGTGVDVWEVSAVHGACGGDTTRTARVLAHLTKQQIEAALRYAHEHVEEIGAMIQENARPPEAWKRLYPHLTARTD